MSFVYVLTNKSMPGLVKVGMTARHPNERASELHSTGVPTPFEVAAIWRVRPEHLKKYERMAHKELEKFRVSSNREFFRIDAKKAIEILSNIIPTPEQVEPARIKNEEERQKFVAAQAVRYEERRVKAAIEHKTQVENSILGYRRLQEELIKKIENYQPNFDDTMERVMRFATSSSFVSISLVVGFGLGIYWLLPIASIDHKIGITKLVILVAVVFNFVLGPLSMALILVFSDMLLDIFGKGRPTKSYLEAQLKETIEKTLALEEKIKTLQQ